ncbi:hypothetical protein NDU88_002855 [Pleurodeles waltl]|uniref:Uncharacterized protein n=1 Tax=Pleurodeles waltl TaxID=8319 RepID=A0AAV7WR38_PLEWA|nr:hypothetical protein NDU88_002855 [Pleurodeles waltl]
MEGQPKLDCNFLWAMCTGCPGRAATLRTELWGVRVHAPDYQSLVMEYLMTEIFKLPDNEALDKKKPAAFPGHLQLTRLLGMVSTGQGRVQLSIQAGLLPKKISSYKAAGNIACFDIARCFRCVEREILKLRELEVLG